ncbi:MAG: ligase-associated DNA damage response endonuclease PdeM [Chitinophagaceae bacterium]|nr:ligase-associated DNA damage response endonuclease PdeM [Chitinophagaceae bacterium]
MLQIIPKIISGNNFLLSADRCIYWDQEQTLILSDLHFGKTGHFRKSGIAVPQNLFKEDIQRFVALLQTFKPENVIVIGDMFHSHDNKEHALFVKWRKDFKQLNIQLVMGNHDILHSDWYRNAGIETINDRLNKGNFSFVHDITAIGNEVQDEKYFFSGHIHPGYSITGMGKQSLRFPCFYFTKQFAVLPAFGKFTGTHSIKPKRGEAVFAIMAANHAKDERAGIIKVF